MYTVKDWNEEVIKWMAVGVVLGLLAMAVASVGVGELAYYYTQSGIFPNDPFVLTVWSSVVGVNAALVGAAVGGPAGLVIGLAVGVALLW